MDKKLSDLIIRKNSSDLLFKKLILAEISSLIEVLEKHFPNVYEDYQYQLYEKLNADDFQELVNRDQKIRESDSLKDYLKK